MDEIQNKKQKNILGVIHHRQNPLESIDSLRLTVYACYSWGMALNVGFGASFDNM
jgi:hypothetical protein